MNRIFGASRSKAPKPSITDAIQATDSRIDSIEVKIRKLDAELSVLRDRMSRLRDGPGKNSLKQKAIKVLRQKKLYESQLDTLQQQTFNMEQTALTTENLRNMMVSVDAMQTANKEMKRQYKSFNIDKIERIHDEMADLLEQSNELQSIMGRSYDLQEDIDEDELDAELEALGDELGEEEVGVGGIPSYLKDEGVPDFLDEAPLDNGPTKVGEAAA
ncbi:Vacuolar protein-sorting-associated protein 60 [Saitoella coloradoensis]